MVVDPRVATLPKVATPRNSQDTVSPLLRAVTTPLHPDMDSRE
jgi:hypothetical protein